MKWKNKGHEFDKIGNYFITHPEFLIYGAGKCGRQLNEILSKVNLQFDYIDANPNLQKNGCNGRTVISPVELEKKYADYNIIIAVSESYRNEIENIVKSYGFQMGVNCWYIDTYLRSVLPIYLEYVEKKIYMESVSFSSTTYCNLNCDACLNFTTYNKRPKHMPIDEAKKTLDYYFSAVSFVRLFSYTGGEPLLYPYIDELLAYIGEKYRNQIYLLAMSTNGTLVPTNKTCEILKHYQVHVYIDDYSQYVASSKKTIPEIIQKFENYQVSYSVNSGKDGYWIDLAPNTTDHSHFTEQELIQWHDKCACPYHDLRKNRLYSCNYASFAMKAGIQVEDKNDIFELENYKKEQSRILLEFLLGYTEKGYVDFCMKCAGFLPLNPYRKPIGKQIIRERKNE